MLSSSGLGSLASLAGGLRNCVFFGFCTTAFSTDNSDSTYRIRVANLAVVDVAGKTYPELKQLVESIVVKNYPMSGVQFVLATPAVFKVTLKGEVNSVQERNAGALSRLSTVVAGSFTAYSSTRDIEITSLSGKKKSCDLFKADRLGDLSQNPYVRPGDVITIKRTSRRVTVNGAIERPGAYQLLEGENYAALVTSYGRTI
jgi:protein involved in polysaccharide export with SLBB domain